MGKIDPGYISVNDNTVVWLLFLLILMAFLFEGDPDLHDAIIQRVMP